MEGEANVEEESQEVEDKTDDPLDVTYSTHTTTKVQSEEGSSARSKKRKSQFDLIVEGVTNAATLLGKELREALSIMNESLKAEVDLQNKTSLPEAVLTFWNLEGDERINFVKLMLEE
ncbi:hypothetical protein Tco_0298232 [Tanacetum coccineum]